MKGKSLDMQIWDRSLQKLNTEDGKGLFSKVSKERVRSMINSENLKFVDRVCNRQLMRCQMSQVRQVSGFEFCTILRQTAKDKKVICKQRCNAMARKLKGFYTRPLQNSH